MPILPFIVAHFGAPKWVYGLLITLYSSFQFIGAPILGKLSDERGRKPILLISQGGTLLSWLIFIAALYLPVIPIWGVALPLIIIALSRVVDGLTGGNTSVTNAYVADITSRSEKSYIFGYLGGVAGVGMIVGPGLGGIAASTSVGYAGTLILAALVSLITLLTIFFWLKESHQPVYDKDAKHQKYTIIGAFNVLGKIRQADPGPSIKLLFLLKLIFSTMMAFYIGTIALFLIDTFDFNEKQLGLFMFVVGMFLSFNQAFLAKRVVKRFGDISTLKIGLVCSFIGLFSITFTSNLYLFIAFYYILNLGFSLLFPTFNSLISIYANPQKQGEIMGISESINSLTMALFPVLAAGVYSVLNYQLYQLMSILPLIGLFTAILYGKYLSQRPQ